MAEYPVMAGQHRRFHREYRASLESILSRVVSLIVSAIVVLIAARFVLLLFGANPEAGFVQFVYSLSGVFMAPFIAVFRTQHVEGATFEWSSLVAIAVYALIGWGLLALIRAVTPREYTSDVEEVDETETHSAHGV